ncbi:MAG: dihydroxy-acid dehydratase [Rubrobacteraceae bacterium]
MSARENGLTSYGDAGFSKFIRMAFSRHLGMSVEDYEKPVIGICDTRSEINRCHTHFGPIVEALKRGILMEGGLPFTFPTISLGEIFTSPTTMLYRNLAAMDTEEMIRAQPLDGVVLLGGCDKTVPAQLMGAASADVPAIQFTGGPMNNGEYKGRALGACSDCRYYWQEYRAGKVDEEELDIINESLAPTAGHCMVMGSASTMAVIAEGLGMMPPGTAAIPATENRRLAAAQETGRLIVRLAERETRPSEIMTRGAFENAMRIFAAVGGSTNAVIHLIAVAGRLGIELTLDDFDRIGRETPLVANLRPAGRYQMEEFSRAGGVPALMKELSTMLRLDEPSVTGKTLGENIEGASVPAAYRDVIRPIEDPLHHDGGLAVLKGNLAPNGAVIKSKAASPSLLKHRGRAVVFSSPEDLEQRVNDPSLEIEPDDIMVLTNAGPVGAPGMPEAGLLPIPEKLLKQGVRDMVRISDCRMSGTASGTIVLHVSPEAAVGGPLALVKEGDEIELDVEERRLDLLIEEEELSKRKADLDAALPTMKAPARRGYIRLYQEHVLQADEGCDFDFLRIARESLAEGPTDLENSSEKQQNIAKTSGE